MKIIVILLFCLKLISFGIVFLENAPIYGGKKLSLNHLDAEETRITKQNLFSITVTINQLKSQNGNIMLELKDEKNTVVKSVTKKISSAVFELILKELPAGNYGIRFFHDENENKKMDFNFFGLPKESYGFSNNVMGMVGPPKYEKTLFELSKNMEIILIAR